MPIGTALLLLGALLGAATALGLLLRSRSGRVRAVHGDPPLTPADLGIPGAFGARATLVQFSTPTCAACPAAARLLGAIADRRDGVRHAEVDLVRHPEVADRFHVLQTPTVLVLDGAGRLRSRSGGAPLAAAVEEAVDDALVPIGASRV